MRAAITSPPQMHRSRHRNASQPAGEERGFGDDSGLAFGPGGDHTDFNFQEIADEAEIVYGGLGQLGGVFYAVSILAPAGKSFVFRDNVFVLFSERRHFVNGPAFVFVACADLDFALGVKDVELGDNQRVDAVDHLGVAEDGEIEPAAAAGAPGDSAEFLAAFAHFLGFEVGHFGGKRTAADARGVGLGNSEHVLDFSWRNAGAGSGSAGSSTRTG